MHQLLALAPIFLLLLAGCASGHKAGSKPAAGEIAQIQHRLEQIIDAAQRKDFETLESFHLYGPHFTKFSTESPYVQDSEVARKGERDGLSKVNGLSMRADDLKIDVFGNVGIATFVLNYSFQGGQSEKQVKTTMVFVKEGNEWKIAHEHLSSTSAK